MKRVLCVPFVFVCTAFGQPDSAGTLREIAVLRFEGNNVASGDLDALTNRLRTALFETGKYTVLERSRVDEILKEQGFQQSGCTNAECAVEVGKLIGVRGIVIGSVDRIERFMTVHVRTVDIQTGQIVASITEDCDNCATVDVMKTTVPRVAKRLAGLPVPAIASTAPQQVKPQPESAPEGMARVGMPGGHYILVDKYEVTQQEFAEVMGENPAKHAGCGKCPVEQVTWEQAAKYCQAMGKRLPTEVEWTYAARGGNDLFFAAARRSPSVYAWWKGNAERRPHAVGTLSSNPYGLYDMLGNVWEWCSDGPSSGPGLVGRVLGATEDKVVKGGSYDSGEKELDPGIKEEHGMDFSNNEIGFRCAK